MLFPNRHSLPHDDNYLEFSFDQFKIIGRSIAGVETVFAIPQLNITFDSGRAPHFAYTNDNLALTHWHLDHAGGVAFYLGLRCLNSLAPLSIIVPDQKVAHAVEFLDCLKKISASDIQYRVLSAAKPHQIRKGLTLKSLQSFHVVPSTGYALYETRHKLKKEFAHKTQAEIVAAKNAGESVQDEFSEMIFAFSGDSRGEFLATEAAQAKVLVMECSFFSEDGDYEKIRQYGHAHIYDWARHADKISSKVVIMSHTSQRYDRKYIEEQCRKHLPKSLLDRLTIFR